jgi:hypothetical protein
MPNDKIDASLHSFLFTRTNPRNAPRGGLPRLYQFFGHFGDRFIPS